VWLLRDESLYVCVCACALCVHGRILSWSQVFRITRGRNPWNTLDDVDVRRKLPSLIEGSWQRDRRRTRRRGSRPVIGRCSCKISILIRKTATAARIVGWNRRRNRAALPGRRRRSFEPPRALCIPDGRVSAFRTQWSETNCRHYDATVVNPVREHEASVRRIHAQFTHIHCYRAGNRVCVCISIFPMKNFFLAVFFKFSLYILHVIIYLIIYLVIFFINILYCFFIKFSNIRNVTFRREEVFYTPVL